ncbi:MAG: OmpA family protein [Myxococcales bacterium]|nr:OmpA family protein [Myxococcales bacterium]
MLLLLATTAFALEAHGFELLGTSGDPAVFTRIGSADAGRSGSWDALLAVDYAQNPLAESFPWGREPVMSSLGTIYLGGGYSFGGLRLDGALPIHAMGEDQTGSFVAPGDARVGILVPTFAEKGLRPAVGVQANLWLPTGDETHHVGGLGPRASAAAVVEKDLGYLGLIAMLGAQVGFPEQDRNLVAGIGPMLALGGRYRITDAASAALEVTSQSDLGLTTWPVEATLSGRYRLPAGAWASVGGAAGLTEGAGAASWRAFVTVGWSYIKPAPPPPPPQIDPHLDTDADGIVDVIDRCDDMAETYDGVEDDDGCPEFDGDQDGVAFDKDACPRDPIRPEQDPRYSDGCPKVAEFAGDRIVITEAIFFAEGRSELMPSAIPVLEAVLGVIEKHPEIPYFLVEGHTNDNGSDLFNLRLSDARAFAVMTWFGARGVPSERLLSKGFGEGRPLLPFGEPDAESVNRRVEVRVVKIEEIPRDARRLTVPVDVTR